MRALALALLVASVGCGEAVSGPRAGMRTSIALALAWPEGAPSGALFDVGIDSVSVVVSRNDESTAYDTTAYFPPNRDALEVVLDFELRQKVETVFVYVGLRAGLSTLFYAQSQVILRERIIPSVPPLPLTYIGPGYVAISVTISPRTTFLFAGSSNQFTATAYDLQGAPTPAPIGWSVSDTRLATVTSTGLMTAKNANGTVWLRALTPTGAGDSINVTVTNVPQLRAP